MSFANYIRPSAQKITFQILKKRWLQIFAAARGLIRNLWQRDRIQLLIMDPIKCK